MRYRWTLILLAAITAGMAFGFAAPQSASADPPDRYWNNYWRWYDKEYRPYYHRRGARRYDYTRDYRYYDGDRYYGRYYGTPRFNYRDYRRGGAVNVGPLRIRWR